jgi:predicted ATPase/DNA-binding winged helix-turn-helix (wHTH) protein
MARSSLATRHSTSRNGSRGLGTTDLDHARREDLVSFGPFRLSPAERLLYRAGKPIHLGARALDILIALVDHAGEVVRKKDLVARVWPGLTVEEPCLRFHIAALRKALGDGSDGVRYVLTLTGQGYCLVAPIVRSSALMTPASEDPISRHRSMLPQQLTRMVGRNETAAEISSQLLATRFVTIVGPGGMGKTTVAVAVSHALLANFDGGVHFIDFGSINDPSLAPSALASTLGLMVHAADPIPGVIKFLRTRRSLLVLDSCEPVIDAAAVLAERISREVPDVHILATSREALRAGREYVHWLSPLQSPPDDIELTAAEALTYPAAQLFVERLIASGQRFGLCDADAPILAKVCRKLDGLALAIELAAGSVTAYGIQGIASLLDSRLTLFWQGHRTAVPRHQTLCATLDWSYDLLPEHERSVLRRLSVFASTFTLEAAQAVSGDDNALVVPALANLVAKSLVAVVCDGGKARYRLLDTTRAYMSEKLFASGEYEEIARHHAIYYRELLDSLARSPAAGAEGYSEHLANVRAALDWGFSARGEIELGIALAVSSAQLFLELSLLTECHRWTHRAIAALGETRGTQTELILQSALGLSLMFIKGNSDEARAALTRGIALAEQLNDVASQLRLLVRLHFFTERIGDFRAALALAQRGQQVAQDLGDPQGVAAAHSMLGSSHHIMGNHSVARPHLEAAAARTQTSPRAMTINYGFDPSSRAAVVLARNLWVLGYSDQATALASRTVATAEASGHPIPICIALIWAVSTYFGTGDWANAQEGINKFIAHADRYSLDSYHAVGVGATGKLRVKRGDAEAGVKLLESSLEALHSRRYELHTAAFNSALAEGCLMLGQFDRALTIIDNTISLVEARGNMFRMPELLRLRGVLLTSRPKVDLRRGEECLLQSLHLAGQQSALAWQLRTASSIARLWFKRGRIEDARNVLAPVYGRFTEGFEFPDLKEARGLLKEIEQYTAMHLMRRLRTRHPIHFGDEAPNLAQLMKPC